MGQRHTGGERVHEGRNGGLSQGYSHMENNPPMVARVGGGGGVTVTVCMKFQKDLERPCEESHNVLKLRCVNLFSV